MGYSVRRFNRLGQYEGQQYRGGRKSTPNLKRLARGRVENQHGVIFTDRERKELERLVNRANAKRKRLIANEEQMELFAAGEKLNAKVADTRMGRESDFVFQRKSKSLQRFSSKEEYRNYIKNLKKVTDPKYMERAARQYKRNFIKALENEGYSQSLINKINRLNADEFLELSRTEVVANFGFVYSKQQRALVEEGISRGIDRLTS